MCFSNLSLACLCFSSTGDGKYFGTEAAPFHHFNSEYLCPGTAVWGTLPGAVTSLYPCGFRLWFALWFKTVLKQRDPPLRETRILGFGINKAFLQELPVGRRGLWTCSGKWKRHIWTRGLSLSLLHSTQFQLCREGNLVPRLKINPPAEVLLFLMRMPAVNRSGLLREVLRL